ncbi:MAG: tetratricopeptide repeat protein [Nitrospirae bacterium]|nr:tetratricopeptide repeat protein [Candidatus Manganitrophaceae bacterium]
MKRFFYRGILWGWVLFSSIQPVWGNESPEVEALFQESLRSDNYERNKTNLEKIINLAPDSAYGHFSKGWFWAQEENYQMAVEEYQTALQARPSFGEARNNLASAYFHLGKWMESIKEYEEVLRQHPDWSETFLNLGSAYYMSGRPFASIQAWEKALRLNPNLPIVHYYLGLIFDRLDRKTEARFHYHQFLATAKNEEEFSEYIEQASQRQSDLWIELGHDHT